MRFGEDAAQSSAPAMMPLAVTVDGAVSLSGASRGKLYEAMRLGELQKLKIGKRTLLRVEDIQNWLNSKAVKAA